jgi:hypothetical protein
MKNYKNLLIRNKQNFIISKLNLNFYYKQYMYYILNNTYIINLKHFEIKLNNLYKLIKILLINNGKLGFLSFNNINFKNKLFHNNFDKNLNKKDVFYFFNNIIFNKNIHIHHLVRGGYFTTNFYLKLKKISDFYFFGDISINNYYILKDIFILKKPIISFIRFDYKDINTILYKLFGNYKNNNVLYFYKKIIYYFILKSFIYKKINFYYYFL